MTFAMPRLDIKIYQCTQSWLYPLAGTALLPFAAFWISTLLMWMMAHSAFALEVPVTIHSIIDGRTLEVRHPGGAITRVRLAGLDVARREVLVQLAPKGKHGFVLLGGSLPQSSPIMAFVYLCSGFQSCTHTSYNLNAEVLRHGRAKFLPNFEDADLRKRLLKAQAQAQRTLRGIWAK